MPRMVRTALFACLLAVGVVSFFFVRIHQGDGSTLASQQQHAQALTPAGVATVVKVAPDPVTRAPGVSASCNPLGSGVLRNPWQCTIHYRSGRVIQYQVTLRADGSYSGDHEVVSYRGQRSRDTGVIKGCCVGVP